MRRTFWVCGAAALALAACSKGPGGKTTEAPASAGGGAAQPAASATAPASAPETPPTRKAGLWEQTMAFQGATQTLRMCVDAATEAQAKWWRTEGARGAGMTCPEQAFTRTGDGWKFHSVCKEAGGMTITSDGVATGDFGSSYHMELASVTAGSPMPEANGTHRMVMDGVWKGACPADMKAGDVEMPGGMRMNVLHPGVPPKPARTAAP